jgi:hypothetical protein
MSAETTTRWSDAKIIERIRELESSGHDLSYNQVAEEHPDLLSAANYHFGSWREAVEAADIDYAASVRRVPKWTKGKIIRTLQEAYRDGVDLSWTNVTTDSELSGMAYAAIRDSRFGSWDDALRAAEIDPSQVRRYESWNRKKILRRIRQRAEAGLPLNSKRMQKDACKLFNAALKRYEGWDRALEAAGIDPDTVYKRHRWNKQLIKERIKEIDRGGGDLAAPAMRDNHSALYSAACKYFGCWTAARRACGITRNFRKRKNGGNGESN